MTTIEGQSVDYILDDPDQLYRLSIVVSSGVISATSFRNVDGHLINKEIIDEEHLGTGRILINKHIETFTSVKDLESNASEIVIKYLINGEKIVELSNKELGESEHIFNQTFNFVEPDPPWSST